MSTGYSRSPKLLKGALIQFSAPMLVPIPNIIVFQFNPEKMTRTVTPWSAPTESGGPAAVPVNTLSQPFDPKESFSFKLELDATDELEFPDSHPVAASVGIAERIAALEMLCYPPGASAITSLVSSVSSSLGSALGAAADAVPRSNVPIVLFYWGPGRLVPVRIEEFSVEELHYMPSLYPIHADITIKLHVVPVEELPSEDGNAVDAAIIKLAKTCYLATQAQKEALATANAANVGEVSGMLPF